MKHLILLLSLLLATNAWSEDEKNHLFTLKCDSSGTNWGVVESNPPFFFIDVYIEGSLNKELADEEAIWGNASKEAFTEIYYKSNRVWWYKLLGGKIYYDLTRYELTNTTHPLPYPQIREYEYASSYHWIDFHQGDLHPHSTVINRISLEASLVFHDDPITNEWTVKPKYSYYKTQCIEANKGDPQKWEKEINTPIDKEIEDKKKELMKKRKI